ncbi:hypothetical protein SRABI06_04193 [Pseudomonas brassicacearum]|nr:hypothetical protein SRABI06_04193 [Pseudomonas brassicacearum]
MLAIAECQLAWMLDVLASSRAGSLPHWFCASPQSPVTHNPSVGASLLAIAVGQLAWMSDVLAPSRASLAPTLDLQWARNLCLAPFPVGAKLARESGGSACQDVGCTGAIAGKPCSHSGSSVGKKLVFGTDPSVGAKLARESGGSACQDAGCVGVIASKLAPILDLQWARTCVRYRFLWEQSLLAIAVGQLAWMLDCTAAIAGKPCSHTGSRR